MSCLECNSGFYRNGHVCSKCSLNCINCDKNGCNLCKKSHFVYNGTCIECSKNCNLCKSYLTCDICKKDHYVSKMAKCVSIEKNCSFCQLCENGMCKLCIDGYFLDKNQKCRKCLQFDQNTCQDCKLHFYGNYWSNETTNQCIPCPLNCRNCEGDGDCISTVNGLLVDGCMEGYVWVVTGTISRCMSCTSVDPVLISIKESCHKCKNLYFTDKCNKCGDETLITQLSCEICNTRPGLYIPNGNCARIECSNASTQLLCEKCNSYYFLNNICVQAVCETNLRIVQTQGECNACDNRIWVMGKCDIGYKCNNFDYWEQDSFDKCGFIWNSLVDKCIPFDCDNVELIISQNHCGQCHNRYWNGNGCKVINCLSDSLDTPEKCTGCKRMKLYWNSTSCIFTTCMSPTSENECNACEGRIWLNNACQTIEYGCDGGIMSTEHKCLHCFGRSVSGTKLVSQLCNNPITPTSCNYCFPFMYWSATELKCKLFTQSVPLTEHICNQALDYYWTGLKCVKYGKNCSTNRVYEAYTEEKCGACRNSKWLPVEGGKCISLNCQSLEEGSIMESTCQKCEKTKQGSMWIRLSIDYTCQKIDCTSKNLITSQVECNVCRGVWVNVDSIFVCKDIYCPTQSLYSSERCEACNVPDNERIWLDGVPSCHTCPFNCVECNSDQCIRCDVNYFLSSDNHECTLCDNTIIALENQCKSCSKRIWSNGVCEFCPKNCNKCSSLSQCIECEFNYVLKKRFINDNSVYQCEKCHLDTIESCNQCTVAPHYFLKAKCSACQIGTILGFRIETAISALTPCHQFIPKFTNMMDLSKLHFNVHSEYKCNKCGLEINNNSMATYWDSVTRTCKNCILNCAKCIDAVTCTQCKDQTYMSLLNNCEPCPEFCQVCDNLACQKCLKGHYMNTELTQCIPCIENCNECNENICISCKTGHSYENLICKKCSINCNSCKSGICTTCQNGYCLNQNNVCISTNLDCQKCFQIDEISEPSCISCNIDYNLQICEKCPLNCEFCDNYNVCNVCAKEHYLLNDQCEKCMTNCATCVNSTECLTCKTGYFYDSLLKTCSNCGMNCITCTSPNTCQKCRYLSQYFNSTSFVCENCRPNCVSCSSTNCLKCLPNFYPIDTNCLNCPQNCKTCLDSNSCDRCLDGFIWDNLLNACTYCTDNCISCKTSSDCLDCKFDSYSLVVNNSTICNQCSGVIPFCDKCHVEVKFNNSLVCDACQHGAAITEDKRCILCQNCNNCIDPPEYCQKCKTNFYLTDNDHCSSFKCYECNSINGCLKNTISDYGCFSAHSCWLTFIKEKSSNVIKSFHQSCKNQTCSNVDNLNCTSISDTLETCQQCCLSHLCNKISDEYVIASAYYLKISSLLLFLYLLLA
ncbi:hypothetical protein A3Q56_02836 [Intoshia linei]|uniref:EGF-like domain-containing protein n=1 Tax=Intoshia linei TaxID=1819745 RepID=A0A177B7K4_9BILA|nr:hypothetical protein A3Q56_02836 [Intoshia linei]